ncbi:PAS domain S-box protein [bacterium]|nr:PAS domain S-box protein [bacterium]MBU1072686.1 PAS domain S-box protein [bacterium]MBU1677150.1 PAS domain S-box protein [bacterium]
MSRGIRRAVPIYRKFLLENKILLFFTCLLVFLSSVVLIAVYWATHHAVSGMLSGRAGEAFEMWGTPIGEAAAAEPAGGLPALLDRAMAWDEHISYLAVVDSAGDLLACRVRPPSAAPKLEAYLTAPVEIPSRDSWNPRDFDEFSFPLSVNDKGVGGLHIGVSAKYGDRIATRAALIAIMLLVMPGALLIGVARIVIRKAIAPLKELTRVADEISAGNLDPGFDFGIHVNCWEIKNCQRTDCEAYLNFTQQCWYIDGTPCEGYESRFPQKLEGCRTCEVYQAHRGDEVVQLADSIRHMTNALKASQELLVSSGDFQKRLIQNSFDGIIATNADGVVNIFNQVAEALIGIPQSEVLGRRQWHEFLDEELEKAMDIPISHEPVRRVRGFAPREATIKRIDGGRINVRLAGISLYERGIHIGKVFFFEDMREIKQLREDLIQSERLAAAGQAAAGISHSIKNIMDGFNGGVYVYQVGRKGRDEEKMAAGFGMIERNVKIISDLAKDLLNFAKERQPELAPHDPRKLVEDVIASVGLPPESKISVRVEQSGPARNVMLDRYVFHQCLSNLVNNAVGAFAEGEEGNIVVELGFAGENAYFAVHDDGMGMSLQTISKIKGGMYSTKGSKGTGLGLQVVQKVVKEHMGVLTIESEEGSGSTFRIEIPAGAVPERA